MEYELAKKLKEAGFPQERKLGFYITSIDEILRTDKIPDSCYQPTLSELLRACPIIENTRLGVDFCDQYEWSAGYSSPDGDTYDDEYVQNCQTPEEAVVLLWLKVNNKKHE